MTDFQFIIYTGQQLLCGSVCNVVLPCTLICLRLTAGSQPEPGYSSVPSLNADADGCLELAAKLASLPPTAPS